MVGVGAAWAAPEEVIPQWIWGGGEDRAGDQVYFRRSFELAGGVESAVLTMTCDNSFRLYVNGKKVAQGADWSNPQSVGIRPHLRKGTNVLAVVGKNDGGVAGLCARLELKTGGKDEVRGTDGVWKWSREEQKGWNGLDFDDAGWAKVVVRGPMGMDPWGALFGVTGGGKDQRAEDVTDRFLVAEGFKLEKLYEVPKEQGSWVALANLDDGRLVACDQYGGLFRITVGETLQVEPWDLPIGGAHGLLWFEGALYVSVNETPGDKSKNRERGVYRITDSNGDGDLDKVSMVKAIKGGGEHGLHSLVPSPDGKWIYFIAGNHTTVPEVDHSWVPPLWKEDHLLPRNPDGRGHARDRMAPGGFICRFKPDGSGWEMISSGYRNPFDMAFNSDGELFAYDADMEWDFGMPWYRPTRLCHVVPGSEFGWRNGTGKWPSYYEDSLPAVVDLGPGSPTGVVSGKGAKFPAKYQRAIYLLDWTYATIYAIHLERDGASYTARKEDFVAGAGLPLTDALIGTDGALYFATGGRRTAGAFWRVSYVGEESTAPVPYTAKSQEIVELGRKKARQQLASKSRHERAIARTELEREGPGVFRKVLSSGGDSQGLITAAVGLARTGQAADRGVILGAMNGLDWRALPRDQQLGALRAYALSFSRLGSPTPGERTAVLAQINAFFPAQDDALNAELCRVLCYLQAPEVVERTLKLMAVSEHNEMPDWAELASRNAGYGGDVLSMLHNMPAARNIHYAYCLRVVNGPWTEGQRRQLFEWFAASSGKSGGKSYALFIKQMEKDVLATATDAERTMVAGWNLGTASDPFKDLPQAEGPGRNWTVEEVTALAGSDLSQADRAHGKKMFQAALCAACHRVDGEGGAAGPDLSAVAGRFAPQDLADALIDPSKAVSDQYNFELITRKDGSVVLGKVLDEKDDALIVAVNPFDFEETTEVHRSDLKSIEPSTVSPMPPGLINRFNETELRDLLAYLLKR